MSNDRLEGVWNRIKGQVKEKWGQLTDDDLTAIGGKHDQFVGRVQERYGIAREQAEKDIDAWLKTVNNW